MTERPIVRCNFGMRGYGKSTLARAMVRARQRLLAHDPMIEHEVLALEWEDFERYVDDSPLERFRVGMITPGYEAIFCATAWEVGGRIGREDELSLSVLLEEADLVAPPGHEPWILKRLAAQGRHRGIELTACSRRPAEVSRYLTALADELNVFRTQEPKDLTYLRGFMHEDAVAVVAGLDSFEFVHWTRAGWDKRVLTDKTGAWRSASTGRVEATKDVDESPDRSVTV